jgi:hypothetical protein
VNCTLERPCVACWFRHQRSLREERVFWQKFEVRS